MSFVLSLMPFALGLPVLVLPVVAAVRAAPQKRQLALLTASYFFLSLCLTSVLWYNASADTSSLIDTVNGWLFGAAVLLAWSTFFSAVAIVRGRQR